MKPKEIVIINLFTKEIEHFAKLSSQVCSNYANKHSYSYLGYNTLLDKSRPPAWSKVIAIQNSFDLIKSKWVWWLDADAVITNMDKKLENIIYEAGEDNFLIISKNPSQINSGSFFIKNCQLAKDFLEEVWSKEEFINHVWWEQKAMIEVLKQEKYFSKVKILGGHVFNAMPDIWEEGMFVVHMPGRFKAMRQRIIEKWSMKWKDK